MAIVAGLFTLVALVGSVVVIGANSMSDAPEEPFEGGWIIAALWVLAAIFWVGWLVG